ncbi:Six-hairpin glycosidase-like protein [Xylariaceae sp. FL0255]|nr:Six-hairpin glycosidase-like protein [Xylariaceae sp. FL0255]
MHKSSFASVFWPAALLLSQPAIGQDDWQQYVRYPSSTTIVKPASVLANYTLGNVTNPNGLIDGSSPTIFSRASGDTTATELVVDFGQNVVGQLIIDFAGSTNGSSAGYPGITLAFSEALEFLTNRSDYTRSDRADEDPIPQIVTTGTDQIGVLNDPWTWTDIWGCQFSSYVCHDGLHGFRYVKITFEALASDSGYTSNDGEFSINSVSLLWNGYAGTPDTYAGWFECSDSNLTQWWYDGTYTVEMGTYYFLENNTEPRDAQSDTLLGKYVLLDGAKRDRDPYTGDLVVSALTTYLAHNDTSDSIRNILEDLAIHQRSDGWIPPASIVNYTLELFDYPLYWVTVSYDYIMYTGNTTYLSDYYPTLLAVLDNYYPANTDNSTNLLTRPDGYGDYAFTGRDGESSYYSALYVLALNRAAELATLNSQPDDASRWTSRAAMISSGVQNLWDPSVSAYFDRLCSGSGCDAHAQDGNSIAILAGIANSTEAISALAYLNNATYQFYGNAFFDAAGEEISSGYSTTVYAFVSFFEMAARFETGDAAGALDMIRRTFGWMSSQDPGITFWEGIGSGGSKYEGATTSLSHGWSTAVTPLMTNYVLGVKPTSPGFETFTVKPVVTDDITWAKGQIPTAYGPLSVSWTRFSNGTIDVVVDAPTGTTGTVGTPVSEQNKRGLGGFVGVEVDGVATRGTISGGYVHVPVEGGKRSVVRDWK